MRYDNKNTLYYLPLGISPSKLKIGEKRKGQITV
jgi:hypothetical protein